MSFRSSITNLSPDHFYLDLTILNNDTTGTKAPVFLTFSEQRDIAILDDPEQWHLSVIRFHLDTPNLPLMLFPVQAGQSDINKSVYSVTLTYGSNEFQQNLVFSPMNSTARTPNPPLTNQDFSTGYYDIYSYTYFINILNNALASAVTGLNALGALPTTVAPYFEWDPNSLKAILNADITGYDLSLATPIKIYFNSPLFTLFSSFDALYYGTNVSNGKNYQFNVRNNQNGNIYFGSGGVNYLQCYQEYATLGVLSNPVDSIVFTTTQIPVCASIQSKPAIFNSTSNESQINTNQKTLQVLTDLQVGLDLGYETKPDIQYVPSAEYRLISLQSNQPLKSYDISVYWKDSASNLYPFYLSSGSAASIKILFRKKGYQNTKLD
jgi:hypothetical protein